MALTEKQIKEFRKDLEESHRPLFLFDDDCDGLCSFLLFYKFKGEGKGIPVKDSPEVRERYAQKVEEYGPDTIFILDKPLVEQDFLDKVKPTKVVWLDHHSPQNKKNVKYYNPRIQDENDSRPTSYWAYQIVKENLWLAGVGTISDWNLPEDLASELTEQYPELLSKDVKSAPEALHDSALGKLIRIFSFNLKGTISDTLASIKTLTRIEDPHEVLDQSSARGKFIYKKANNLMNRYEELLASVNIGESKLVVFTYTATGYSFSSDLGNELLYRNPNKVFIIGRIDSGFVKCSIRSGDVDHRDALLECLKNVNGKGGGHQKATGACIAENDFDKFVFCFEKKL